MPRARYYNPFFLAGGVLFTVGMGLISKIDENIGTLHLVGLQIGTGIGVGILVLANVAPCNTDLAEKDHSIANGLAFFSSSLGSYVAITLRYRKTANNHTQYNNSSCLQRLVQS